MTFLCAVSGPAAAAVTERLVTERLVTERMAETNVMRSGASD
jgi:hypothetical protein